MTGWAREAERSDVRLIGPDDEEWPMARLAALRMAALDGASDLPMPVGLWLRGARRLDELAARAVAIVGAMDATPYGVRTASDLARGLVRRGWTVVSGGGHGIAGAAHQGALSVDGASVVVVPSGLRHPYPPGHAGLFDWITSGGLLVSEWPPDTPSHRQRSLARNRFVAALAAGTVVVEANGVPGPGSVTRHTLQLGRPLMVLPGPVTSPLSAGCHGLLQREPPAHLVTGVRDVLAVLEPGTEDDIPFDLAESEDA